MSYLRASTSTQRNTPEAQRPRIDDWARREGVEVVACHADLGVSGTKPLPKRPGLLDAIGALKETRAGILVAACRDRFMRDSLQMALLEHAVRCLGARLATVAGIESSDTAEAKLINTVVDAVFEYEAALTGARTRRILEHRKRSRPQYSGKAPYGYEYVDGELVPSRREQRTIEVMARLRRCGLTYQLIADELARQGYRPRGRQWHHASVYKIVKRHSANQAPPPGELADSRAAAEPPPGAR